MSDAPSFTFSARQKRGDLPCVDPDLLMKIVVARYGEVPEFAGPGIAALRQYRMGQVQLMLDAIISVVPDVRLALAGLPRELADTMAYAVELEGKLTQSVFTIAQIHQAARDHLDGKERVP